MKVSLFLVAEVPVDSYGTIRTDDGPNVDSHCHPPPKSRVPICYWKGYGILKHGFDILKSRRRPATETLVHGINRSNDYFTAAGLIDHSSLRGVCSMFQCLRCHVTPFKYCIRKTPRHKVHGP